MCEMPDLPDVTAQRLAIYKSGHVGFDCYGAASSTPPMTASGWCKVSGEQALKVSGEQALLACEKYNKPV